MVPATATKASYRICVPNCPGPGQSIINGQCQQPLVFLQSFTSGKNVGVISRYTSNGQVNAASDAPPPFANALSLPANGGYYQQSLPLLSNTQYSLGWYMKMADSSNFPIVTTLAGQELVWGNLPTGSNWGYYVTQIHTYKKSDAIGGLDGPPSGASVPSPLTLRITNKGSVPLFLNQISVGGLAKILESSSHRIADRG